MCICNKIHKSMCISKHRFHRMNKNSCAPNTTSNSYSLTTLCWGLHVHSAGCVCMGAIAVCTTCAVVVVFVSSNEHATQHLNISPDSPTCLLKFDIGFIRHTALLVLCITLCACAYFSRYCCCRFVLHLQ